jgi:hypothetical protein
MNKEHDPIGTAVFGDDFDDLYELDDETGQIRLAMDRAYNRPSDDDA